MDRMAAACRYKVERYSTFRRLGGAGYKALSAHLKAKLDLLGWAQLQSRDMN